MSKIIAYLNAIQYDGTNSAAILTAINVGGGSAVIDSETGGVLTIGSCGNHDNVAVTDWVRYDHFCVVQVHHDGSFHRDYLLDTEISGDQSALTGVGTATVPALLLGASTTVAVDVAPAQADSSYSVVARLVGAVGSLTVTSTSVVDVDTVNVTVHAGVAYLAGAQVLVLAYE